MEDLKTEYNKVRVSGMVSFDNLKVKCLTEAYSQGYKSQSQVNSYVRSVISELIFTLQD